MGFWECVKKGWDAFTGCLDEEAKPPAPPEPPKDDVPPPADTKADDKKDGDVHIPPPPPVPADLKAGEKKDEEKGPDTARSGQGPYREPAPEPPKPEWEELCVKDGHRFSCKVKEKGKLSLEEFQKVRAKAQRRALRHFDGKEVRHRVVRKDAQEIEFAFYRRSYSKGPVKLVIRKEIIEPNVAQVGSA